jgi:hypothetical protein
MGLGILESHRPPYTGTNVPGTATVLDTETERIREQEQRTGRKLKRTSDGTILVPQPSDDPKDPLVSIISIL